MRREFSAKVCAAAFQRADGRCEGERNGDRCGTRLTVGKFRYDHILPDWLGGEPTLANCQVICMACDGAKTQADQTRIAKTKRIRARHIGAVSPSSRPMPGSRRDKFRKKVSGEVVLR